MTMRDSEQAGSMRAWIGSSAYWLRVRQKEWEDTFRSKYSDGSVLHIDAIKPTNDAADEVVAALGSADLFGGRSLVFIRIAGPDGALFSERIWERVAERKKTLPSTVTAVFIAAGWSGVATLPEYVREVFGNDVGVVLVPGEQQIASWIQKLADRYSVELTHGAKSTLLHVAVQVSDQSKQSSDDAWWLVETAIAAVAGRKGITADDLSLPEENGGRGWLDPVFGLLARGIGDVSEVKNIIRTESELKDTVGLLDWQAGIWAAAAQEPVMPQGMQAWAWKKAQSVVRQRPSREWVELYARVATLVLMSRANPAEAWRRWAWLLRKSVKNSAKK